MYIEYFKLKQTTSTVLIPFTAEEQDRVLITKEEIKFVLSPEAVRIGNDIIRHIGDRIKHLCIVVEPNSWASFYLGILIDYAIKYCDLDGLVVKNRTISNADYGDGRVDFKAITMDHVILNPHASKSLFPQINCISCMTLNCCQNVPTAGNALNSEFGNYTIGQLHVVLPANSDNLVLWSKIWSASLASALVNKLAVSATEASLKYLPNEKPKGIDTGLILGNIQEKINCQFT